MLSRYPDVLRLVCLSVCIGLPVPESIKMDCGRLVYLPVRLSLCLCVTQISQSLLFILKWKLKLISLLEHKPWWQCLVKILHCVKSRVKSYDKLRFSTVDFGRWAPNYLVENIGFVVVWQVSWAHGNETMRPDHVMYTIFLLPKQC